ncbi:MULTISPECIES: BT_3928 family protein [unclassified Capnocytophaga]|uniref:BT_3928 family protein n=1 Tax=unclassified Capnocytophaga TaxID=2640652 RepID=UPI000202D6CA|nr:MULTISPECIES: BT_3928 family protein [unclassified Capnocytophaga]EGD33866.1 triose-phosphate isomerase [Capnocytophaga sp. oral taxon 338 str. F0234]MEB3004985.1 BT_3928 family protein [Capnocytophaga sp. G2]
MKKASASIIRFLVGIIFIISGFVKLVDPMGFSFKLEEYFHPTVLNIEFFTPYAYPIAVFVVAFELILGVLLLLGAFKHFTLISLLGLTIFFGFLTFYTAYFNKVTDCGCFGDALKFTPWGSFTKDMILLALIIILWLLREYITPLYSQRTSIVLLLLTIIACGWLVYYTHKHLPIIDFRPYKIGVNIEKGMEIPSDAPKPIYDYHWKFKVGDREEVITTQGAYPEVEEGTFISVETEQISKGYQPPIHDFVIEKDGEDYTQSMLEESKLLMIISYDLSKADEKGFSPIKKLTDKALKKGYKVIGLTPSPEQAKILITKYGLNFDFYATDLTTLKTMVRANPAIIRLERGTIKQKVSYNDVQKIDL